MTAPNFAPHHLASHRSAPPRGRGVAHRTPMLLSLGSFVLTYSFHCQCPSCHGCFLSGRRSETAPKRRATHNSAQC